MTDLEALQAAYRATWSLFIAVETGNDDVIEAICDEYDEDALLKGWHIVASRLRMALREHGESLGCGCGSDDWLEAERLHIADGGD